MIHSSIIVCSHDIYVSTSLSNKVILMTDIYKKLEVSVNVYILLGLVFGRKREDVLEFVFKALSKLDAIKAFDRV